MLRPYAHRSQPNVCSSVADLQCSPFCAYQQYENRSELQLPPPFLDELPPLAYFRVTWSVSFLRVHHARLARLPPTDAALKNRPVGS